MMEKEPMQVLLVDDDANFRRSLAIGLESMGVGVHEAKSGMDALQFLKANQDSEAPVTGVVLDAKMPGLDGFWLADQIRVTWPHLQVVMLSAHLYPQHEDRYACLTKPVKLKDLVDLLEDVTEWHSRE